MKYKEDELLPISALQHLLFCERQWALIHLEQLWKDNRFTAEGNVMHTQAHEPGTESRKDLRITRGLRLQSLNLGLSGQADIVEFNLIDSKCTDNLEGITLPGLKGKWKPMPVEYKRGKQKVNDCDRVQLCAQALCLEEMLDVHIPHGALYYGEPRRRELVELSESLRTITQNAAKRLHKLHQTGATPPPIWKRECKSCSLIDLCLPQVSENTDFINRYMKTLTQTAIGEMEV